MSKYPVNKNQSSDLEKKTNESALQKLLQKQTQKPSQTNVTEEEQLNKGKYVLNMIFGVFLCNFRITGTTNLKFLCYFCYIS